MEGINEAAKSQQKPMLENLLERLDRAVSEATEQNSKLEHKLNRIHTIPKPDISEKAESPTPVSFVDNFEMLIRVLNTENEKRGWLLSLLEQVV